MFTPNQRTTDTIIQPLLKVIQQLEDHIKTQTVDAASHDISIEELKAKRDFKLIDADSAKKVLENFKSIVGA